MNPCNNMGVAIIYTLVAVFIDVAIGSYMKNKGIRTFFAGIYWIISFLLVFYGIPMAIVNIGKEHFVLYLCLGVMGIVAVICGVAFTLIKKKKSDIDPDQDLK